LFENLVIHDLRIYAELINASISYIRDETGYEIDCVIENRDGTFAVFEIKLGSKEGIETGIKNLNKLESKLTEDKYKKLISKNIIVATGFSYRHESGINIIAFGDLFFDSTIL
jgi:predicted AAA+ superfamily ATPase